jgi:hypothetical protein
MSGNPLFGDGWRGTPRAAEGAHYVAPPTHLACWVCGEQIHLTDSGEIMGSPDGAVAMHRECGLLNVVGHVFRLCSCTDYGGLSKREAGIVLAHRIETGWEPDE